MPKRRTEDAVHVVVTDHYIQRRKPAGDLLAQRAERHETEATAYRGEVVPYYPEALPHTAENDLLAAVAQVIEQSNLSDGIRQLTAAVEKYLPQRAEYYLELAEALRNNGQPAKALPLYREAVRQNPNFVSGLQKLGSALRRGGQLSESAEYLRRAVSAAPENAAAWHELALTYRAQGKTTDAIGALEKAVALDPDFAEAHSNLGILWFAAGQTARADRRFARPFAFSPITRTRTVIWPIFFRLAAISRRPNGTSKPRCGSGRKMRPRATTTPWRWDGRAG
jgi:Putative Zn-dependent protease, contains TPR repeats